MGVVYKAVDCHLDRTAAIKVLVGSAVSADREKRFVQEAKAASSLNHANIVTIYDIDTALIRDLDSRNSTFGRGLGWMFPIDHLQTKLAASLLSLLPLYTASCG